MILFVFFLQENSQNFFRLNDNFHGLTFDFFLSSIHILCSGILYYRTVKCKKNWVFSFESRFGATRRACCWQLFLLTRCFKLVLVLSQIISVTFFYCTFVFFRFLRVTNIVNSSEFILYLNACGSYLPMFKLYSIFTFNERLFSRLSYIVYS